jgi:hypothetical protein
MLVLRSEWVELDGDRNEKFYNGSGSFDCRSLVHWTIRSLGHLIARTFDCWVFGHFLTSNLVAGPLVVGIKILVNLTPELLRWIEKNAQNITLNSFFYPSKIMRNEIRPNDL